MDHIFLSYAQIDASVGLRLKKDLLQTGRAIRTDESYTPGSDEWRQYIAANVPDAACVVMVPTLTMGLRAWLWIEELARLGKHVICVFRIEEEFVVVRTYQELRLDTAKNSKTTFIGEGVDYEIGFQQLLERLYVVLAADVETGTIPKSLLDLAETDIEADEGEEVGGIDDTITLDRKQSSVTGWAGEKAPSEMDIQAWLEALRERHMSRPQDIPTDAGFRIPDLDTTQVKRERPSTPPSVPPAATTTTATPTPAPPPKPTTPAQPAQPRPAPARQAPPAPPQPVPAGPSMDTDTKPVDYEQLQAEWRAITPQFTAFWPELAQPAKSYPLMVYIHREELLDQVRDVARGFAAAMGGRQASGVGASFAPLQSGTVLTIVPQIGGLTFDPPSSTLVWNPAEAYQSATFIFAVPTAPIHTYSGWILVYEGPIILGKIDVTIRVAQSLPRTVPPGETRSTSGEGQLESLEVFASYAHRDTPVMEYFRRTHQESGQNLLVDVYALRAGEDWNTRLLEMIDGADVFQLFWSRRSARSEYVEREWRHALQFTQRRPRFIQPVWWEDPLEPPPTELAHLHFQRVELPVGTQVQMTLSRLRNFINRKR